MALLLCLGAASVATAQDVAEDAAPLRREHLADIDTRRWQTELHVQQLEPRLKALLAALEVATEGEAFSPADLIGDAVGVLLTIGACVAVMAMVRRTGSHEAPDARRSARGRPEAIDASPRM